MGRVCRICGCSRPNERFGGKGMRAIVCSKCRKRPRKERDRILATEEIYGFMIQKNISSRNITRLEELVGIDDPQFQELRSLVLEIASVHPRKRRRWNVIPQQHPSLFKRIVDSQLFDHLLNGFYATTHYEEVLDEEVLDEEVLTEANDCLIGIWLENREP